VCHLAQSQPPHGHQENNQQAEGDAEPQTDMVFAHAKSEGGSNAKFVFENEDGEGIPLKIVIWRIASPWQFR
jgi:hypothetical protein